MSKLAKGLAPFAGHDPYEKEMGWQGWRHTKRSLALAASRAALVRYARLRAAARFNPPQAATGGFSYFTKETSR